MVVSVFEGCCIGDEVIFFVDVFIKEWSYLFFSGCYYISDLVVIKWKNKVKIKRK